MPGLSLLDLPLGRTCCAVVVAQKAKTTQNNPLLNLERCLGNGCATLPRLF